MDINLSSFKQALREAIKDDPTILEIKRDISGLKEDGTGLKADVAVLKADVAVLKADVAVLKADVAVLKADVAVLKADVAVLKADVAEIKTDMRNLTLRVDENTRELVRLNEAVFHQGVNIEEMNHNIKIILEALVPAQKRSEQIGSLISTADHHDGRLSAVEMTVKSHVQDKSLHSR